MSALLPPWKVGVAPTTEPEEDSTVTLWESGELLVKAIATFPAFALSEVVSYFNWPSELVARRRAPAGAEDVVGVDCAVVADVVAGVDAEEPVLLELPQPASASIPPASASSGTIEVRQGLA